MVSKITLSDVGGAFDMVLTDDVLGDLPTLNSVSEESVIAYAKGATGATFNFEIVGNRVVLGGKPAAKPKVKAVAGDGSKAIQKKFNAFINKYWEFGEENCSGSMCTSKYSGDWFHVKKDVSPADVFRDLIELKKMSGMSVRDLIFGYTHPCVKNGVFHYSHYTHYPYESAKTKEYWKSIYYAIGESLESLYKKLDSIDKSMDATLVYIDCGVCTWGNIPEEFVTDDVKYHFVTMRCTRDFRVEAEPANMDLKSLKDNLRWCSVSDSFFPISVDLAKEMLKYNRFLLRTILWHKGTKYYDLGADYVDALIQSHSWDEGDVKALFQDLYRVKPLPVESLNYVVAQAPWSVAKWVYDQVACYSTLHGRDYIDPKKSSNYDSYVDAMGVLTDENLLGMINAKPLLFDMVTDADRRERLRSMRRG